jgi:hypothetical protein
MVDERDWRPYPGIEEDYSGLVLFRRRFRAKYQSDHEHCELCSAEFMDKDDPSYLNTEVHPVLEEGYTTDGNSDWICDQCFNDFHERLAWTVLEDLN